MQSMKLCINRNIVYFRAPFSIEKVTGTDITLENPFLKATFSGANGLLKVCMVNQGMKRYKLSSFHPNRLES